MKKKFIWSAYLFTVFLSIRLINEITIDTVYVGINICEEAKKSNRQSSQIHYPREIVRGLLFTMNQLKKDKLLLKPYFKENRFEIFYQHVSRVESLTKYKDFFEVEMTTNILENMIEVLAEVPDLAWIRNAIERHREELYQMRYEENVSEISSR